jgi:hypothetical protein
MGGQLFNRSLRDPSIVRTGLERSNWLELSAGVKGLLQQAFAAADAFR